MSKHFHILKVSCECDHCYQNNGSIVERLLKRTQAYIDKKLVYSNASDEFIRGANHVLAKIRKNEV